MPATRIVVLERGRAIDRSLRQSSDDLPIEVRSSRTLDEFVERLSERPNPIAVVEHEGELDASIAAAEAARRISDFVFLFHSAPINEIDEASLRMAGCRSLLSPPPSRESWRAVVRRWVGEAQAKMKLGDPTAH